MDLVQSARTEETQAHRWNLEMVNIANPMPLLYRVLERTGTGAEVIAEVREDGTVTGKSADFIRAMIKRYGYPDVPLEEALYGFRFTASTYIGIERVDIPADGQ